MTISWGFLVGFELIFAVSCTLIAWGLRKNSRMNFRLARWVLGFGFLLYAAHLLRAVTSYSLMAVDGRWWVFGLLMVTTWVLSFRRSQLLLVSILIPLLGVTLIVNALLPSSASSEVGLLPSPWLWLHIVLMILGEVCFLIQGCLGVLYLVSSWKLRRRQYASLYARITSLDDIDRWMSEVLVVGFLLLSFGMITGVFFARQFWLSYATDPKVIFCGLTWLVYAGLLLARRWKVGFRGKHLAVGSVVGVVTVIFLGIGVDFVLPTSHPGSTRIFEGAL